MGPHQENKPEFTEIEENMKIQANGFKNIFNERVTENFSHIRNEIDIYLQQALRTPNRQGQNRNLQDTPYSNYLRKKIRKDYQTLQEKNIRSHL